MELLHPLLLQEAAKEGEALSHGARATQVRAWGGLAAPGQWVGELVGGRGQPPGPGSCCVHGWRGLWAQPAHGVQPPFPPDTRGFGPDGFVPKSCSGEFSSAREELPSAETCCSFGVRGSGLASAPCGKGSRERREEQRCCRGGRMALIITPSHLRCGHSHECHWHICSEREK